MLSSALSLFLLRGLPFARFAFPRWHSVLAITLIGLLTGLGPTLFKEPGAPALPLWAVIGVSTLSEWVSFLIGLGILHWWMKRGGRWDGRGDLFNLVAASWLIADTLVSGLVALGLPALLTLPLWLYSVWIGAVALSGGIPRASRGYSVGGIIIGQIPIGVAIGIISLALGIVAAMLDVPLIALPPP